MNDLTTYRMGCGSEEADWGALCYIAHTLNCMVPDGRLQAIADILPDLLELAESGIGYTPDYFREKWDMDNELTEIKAKLRDALGGTDNE